MSARRGLSLAAYDTDGEGSSLINGEPASMDSRKNPFLLTRRLSFILREQLLAQIGKPYASLCVIVMLFSFASLLHTESP
jgi:hypothetical protein